MEKFLEPIELNDAELYAVAGGAITTGAITNSTGIGALVSLTQTTGGVSVAQANTQDAQVNTGFFGNSTS
jgi:FAD/FMN-containing dehydrogenase